MYINGRKITLEELQQLADNLVGSLIDDIYESIVKDGIDAACPGPKDRQIGVINKMIQHYVDLEEYEKCAYLRDKI
jgi:hypothetical protein